MPRGKGEKMKTLPEHTIDVWCNEDRTKPNTATLTENWYAWEWARSAESHHVFTRVEATYHVIAHGFPISKLEALRVTLLCENGHIDRIDLNPDRK